MNSREAERQIYRTTTVGQLVAALVESRDHTDIRHVFGHHEGGTRGFGIACQRLGISKNGWDHANNAAGFYALIPIIAEKLGLPRYDPAAEQARREEVAAVIKSPALAQDVRARSKQTDRLREHAFEPSLIPFWLIALACLRGSYNCGLQLLSRCHPSTMDSVR